MSHDRARKLVAVSVYSQVHLYKVTFAQLSVEFANQ